jgi:hypothetical protein
LREFPFDAAEGMQTKYIAHRTSSRNSSFCNVPGVAIADTKRHHDWTENNENKAGKVAGAKATASPLGRSWREGFGFWTRCYGYAATREGAMTALPKTGGGKKPPHFPDSEKLLSL